MADEPPTACPICNVTDCDCPPMEDTGFAGDWPGGETANPEIKPLYQLIIPDPGEQKRQDGYLVSLDLIEYIRDNIDADWVKVSDD